MLAIINATTSHELRNPLSAMITQNIKKEALYNQIKQMCQSKNSYDHISDIVDELFECTKIQNSSGKIMTFLIQDLLDFAQMKAGKFRKNIQEFNIQEAIEEVMSIQKDQAARKGVELSLNLINISTEINPI